jgi:hypothetical protein
MKTIFLKKKNKLKIILFKRIKNSKSKLTIKISLFFDFKI